MGLGHNYQNKETRAHADHLEYVLIWKTHGHREKRFLKSGLCRFFPARPCSLCIDVSQVFLCVLLHLKRNTVLKVTRLSASHTRFETVN